MSNNTSVGRGPASGGNEDHSGDPTNKTLGEEVKQQPPAGSAGDVLDEAAADVPGKPPADID